MNHSRGSIVAPDSTKLAYQCWLPEQSPEGVFLFVHGIGGHSGQPTYTYLIDFLVGAGLVVYGLDLRGHGNSEGPRGHVNRWGDYLDDVSTMLQKLRSDHPDIPLFLFGQSLGGLISLEVAIEKGSELSGVIASAPALALKNPTLVFLVRLISNIFPLLKVDIGLDPRLFTRDTQELPRLKDDPLRQPRVTTRVLGGVHEAIPRVHANAHLLKIPVLIIVGEADGVTPPHGTKKFIDNATIADKMLKTYEGGYHQPMVDINRDEVFADILGWIRAHMPVPS
ncbi:MAG: alpha/beta hydrolase [Moorea sp. SIO2B7]|nr:alpha/beta hydrolase [Moorena sp. SIO2B7]